VPVPVPDTRTGSSWEREGLVERERGLASLKLARRVRGVEAGANHFGGWNKLRDSKGAVYWVGLDEGTAGGELKDKSFELVRSYSDGWCDVQYMAPFG
jgi:hypothetical protein